MVRLGNWQNFQKKRKGNELLLQNRSEDIKERYRTYSLKRVVKKMKRREEVTVALKKMKYVKVFRLDGIVDEMLSYGGVYIIK